MTTRTETSGFLATPSGNNQRRNQRRKNQRQGPLCRSHGPRQYLSDGEPVQVSRVPGHPEGAGVHPLWTHLLHVLHQHLLGPGRVGEVQLPPVPGDIQPSAGAAEEHGAGRGRRQTQAERSIRGPGTLRGRSRRRALRLLPGREQAEGGQVVPSVPGVLLRAPRCAAPGGGHAAATQAGGRRGVPPGAAVRSAPAGSGARGGRLRGGRGVERRLPAVRGGPGGGA